MGVMGRTVSSDGYIEASPWDLCVNPHLESWSLQIPSVRMRTVLKGFASRPLGAGSVVGLEGELR